MNYAGVPGPYILLGLRHNGFRNALRFALRNGLINLALNPLF